jgi:hypothetical protein
MIVDVTSVEVLKPYRLRLEFDDGTAGEVDVSELVRFNGVFAPLRDPDVFRQVRLDEEFGTIVWPNGADLDPFVLHEWAAGRKIQKDEEIFAPDQLIPPTAVRPIQSLRHDPPPAELLEMPEISRFFGIVVKMWYGDHFPPHFHVFYAGDSAVFAIEPARLLRGSLPPRALGLVVEWASLRTAELLDDWDRSRLGEPLQRIEPLE